MISFTYQYKLNPTKKQIRDIEMYLDTCRKVYNFNHGERKDWLDSRKSLLDRCSLEKEYITPADKPFPNYHIQSASLTVAKQIYPNLKQVHSQVLQSTLKRLDTAWNDFFRVKDRGFPKFKNARRFRSFLYPQIKQSDLKYRQVRLPKIGWIRIRKSRNYPLGFLPKQLRIVRKARGYFAQIIFSASEAVPEITPGRRSLGLDAGISSFVATSTGELIKTPPFVLKVSRKLKSLQRKLKNKVKGSQNWLKLQNKIAKLHDKVVSTRTDWLFKLAHRLCDETDNVFVEEIDFRSWQRGLFGKQINNSAVGKFMNEILPFVCFKRGVFYLKVDKNYTSQVCPNCQVLTGKKLLSQRIHHCRFCSFKIDRDLASAMVVEQRGTVAVGHTVTKQAGLAQIACGDRGAGVVQLSLFDLVTG